MRNFPRRHLTLIAALSIIFVVLLLTDPSTNTDSQLENGRQIELALPIETHISSGEQDLPSAEQAIMQSLPPKLVFVVKPGDNLSTLFARHQLPAGDLQRVLQTENADMLATVKPGQSIEIQKNLEGRVLELVYQANPKTKLISKLLASGYVTEIEHVEPDMVINAFEGNITRENSSLYHAGLAAGLTDNLIMQLADLFQWDISFALDLREGDVFTVIVARSSIAGEPIGEDRILAAAFTNFGKRHIALRYVDTNQRPGYYNEIGESLRKAFLRDPVHFSHVSSSFNLRRKHPIHKRTMPHRGIDYAANRGTPVRAAGEGKIIKAERNDASGNFVVIQHGDRYTTKYLHLSRFAKAIKPGVRVSQSQTIGYVGATGWATGPHLHYEFLVDGVHRNPRTVRLPDSKPVPAQELEAFRETTQPLLAALENANERTLMLVQNF